MVDFHVMLNIKMSMRVQTRRLGRCMDRSVFGYRGMVD